jgi:excisionase family DNA binding protein
MVNKETGKELLSVDEAASRLKITKRTILRWAREKKIESVKASREEVLFTVEDIEKFVKSKKIGIESAARNHQPAGRKTSQETRKGGGKKTSGELWRDLRKEVLSCQ